MNRNQQRRCVCAVLAAVGTMAVTAQYAAADTASWTRGNSTSNGWTQPLNWETPDGAPLPPNSLNTDVIFTGVPIVAGSVTQGTASAPSQSVRGLTITPTFNPGGNFNVSGQSAVQGSNLTIGAGGIDMQHATLQFGFTTNASSTATITLAADQTWRNVGGGTAGTLSIGRVVTGAFKITKAGNGLLIFNQASPGWSGGLDVQEGSVRFTNFDIMAGNNGTLTMNSNNDVLITASGATQVDQTISGQINFGGTGTATFGGSWDFKWNSQVNMLTNKNVGASHTIFANAPITGPGRLTQTSGGTLLLGAANTNGGFTANLGRIATSNDNQLGAAGAFVGLNGGTLVTTASINSTRAIQLGSGNATLDSQGNNGTFGTVGGAGNVAAGSGTFNTLGASTLRFTSVRASSLNVGTNNLVSIAPNGAASSASHVATNLAINTGGAIDLNDNDMVVGSATPTATVRGLLTSGYAAGSQNGLGIRSSAGADNGSTTLGYLTGDEYNNVGGTGTFDGITYGSNDTLIKYTYYGDVDFSGSIDITDYILIDQGFQNGSTGWANGDVDFSGGAPDIVDYILTDQAFQNQGGTVLRAIAYLDGTDRSSQGMNAPSLQKLVEHVNEFGPGYASAMLAALPEPTSAGAVITLLAGALGRRQRRHQRMASR